MDIPSGATTQSVLEYVRAAVPSLCRDLPNEDPMSQLDKTTITVSLLQKVTSYA
jgi:hypothetical protein